MPVPSSGATGNHAGPANVQAVMTRRPTARSRAALVVLALLLAGCGDRPADPALASSAAPSASTTPAAGGAGTAGASSPSVAVSLVRVEAGAAASTPTSALTVPPSTPLRSAPPSRPPEAPTVTTAPPTTQTAPPADTGVRGTVTAGPSCPVETPDRPCPPRPVAGRVEARSGSGGLAASTATDAGAYVLRLPPGTYTITVVTGAVLPRCPAVTVAVPASGTATADIACDSGIR